MKPFIVGIILMFIVFPGCAKDEPPRPEDGVALTVPQSQQAGDISASPGPAGGAPTPGEPQAAASSPDSGSAVLSDAEDSTDQSSPSAALLSFLTELNIVLDPGYALDSGDAGRVARGLQAHRRLRLLFASHEVATEVCGYLGLIRVAGVKMTTEAAVDGDRATVSVLIAKGQGLELDPKRFGETSDTEAETKVDFIRRDGRWLISDFGGLAAFAE